MNTNEVKTVKFSEKMYEKEGERKIIQDGIRIVNYAKNNTALMDVLTNKDGSGITVSKIDTWLPNDVIKAIGIDDSHSGASWSAVCWAAVQVAQGYKIIGNWHDSDKLAETL